MPSPLSIRPSGSAGRRSSAFVREALLEVEFTWRGVIRERARTGLAVANSATARFAPIPLTIINRPAKPGGTMKNEDQPSGRGRKPMKIRTIITATCAALAFSMAGPVYAHDGEAQTITKNFEAAIPNIPGKSLLAVEVDYAPGAASPSHTHAKSAFIYAYVISGAIESKVNDGETRIYRAGESWSEPPGAIHSISRNASKTEPAKLLAVFVLDTNDNPLTTPIK